MKLPAPEIPPFKLNPNQQFPELVVYSDKNFQGESWRTNLSYSFVGDHWEYMTSSVIVVSGIWEFWSEVDYTGDCCKLGQGYYPNLRSECDVTGSVYKGIKSFRCVNA
jgi:hypothetical protein